MNPHFVATLAVAQVLTLAGAVHAADLTKPSEGYTYFNRPGADMAAHRADMQACFASASNAHQPYDSKATTVGALAGGLVGAVVSVELQRVEDRHARWINVENCMVVHGWRVVRLPEAEGGSLAKLDPIQLNAALSPLVGAAEPIGEVVRQWHNEAASADTIKYRRESGVVDEKLSQLSQRLLDEANAAPPNSRWAGALMFPRFGKPLKPGEYDSVGPDKALLILRLRGAEQYSDQGLIFARTLEAADAGRRDMKTAAVTALVPRRWPHQKTFETDDHVLVFAVEPGRWSLRDLVGPDSFIVDFCLGAPAFDIKPGEVVFAGDFDVTDKISAPNFSVERARPALDGHPALQGKLRSAEYTNGEVGECGGTYIYALELKDVPFAKSNSSGATAVR